MPKKKEKKPAKPPRPEVWTATFTHVWMISPLTHAIATRKGRVKVFTVASDQEEAILTMCNGFRMQYDDIEDPGCATRIRTLGGPQSEAVEKMRLMLEDGARFIIPLGRLSRSMELLIAMVLLNG